MPGFDYQDMRLVKEEELRAAFDSGLETTDDDLKNSLSIELFEKYLSPNLA